MIRQGMRLRRRSRQVPPHLLRAQPSRYWVVRQLGATIHAPRSEVATSAFYLGRSWRETGPGQNGAIPSGALTSLTDETNPYFRPLASRHRPIGENEIAPELQAPITGEIERQLKQLVAQFGEKKVLEPPDPLVTKRKWNYWQCVTNTIWRIARQK